MIKNIPENEKESLGEFLRRTREEQGLSLEEVADATKISLYNLHAIEEDDYANLPAEVFVRGFCGIYAAHLSLDPHMVREHFNEQKLNMPIRSTKKAPTPTQLALETSSMAERPTVTSHSVIGISLLVVFIIVASICWLLSWNPATYLSQKLRGVSTEQPAVTAEPKEVIDKASDQVTTQAEPAPTSPVTLTTPPAVTPDITTPEKPITGEQPSSTASVSSTQPVQSAAVPAQPVLTPTANTYILKAISKETTKITVKVDEKPADQLTLAAGESRSWNAGKSIVVTLPAGTGTTFTLNDIPLNLPKKPAGQEITVSIPEYLLE